VELAGGDQRPLVTFLVQATVAGCITSPPPPPPSTQPIVVATVAPAPAPGSSLDYYALARISLGDAAEPPRDAPPVAPPDDIGRRLSGVKQVVAGLGPSFGACDSPDVAGKVVIAIRIGANGSVLSATPIRVEGLQEETVRCVLRVIQTASFQSSDAGEIRWVLPLRFK
jgi:hypothetical protein